MMDIIRHENHWVIAHAGKIIDQNFDSIDAAESWADGNIDDQMFDDPNTLCPPLQYREGWVVRQVPKES